MLRRVLFVPLLALAVAPPSTLYAQSEPFTQAVLDFLRAADGVSGDDGRALVAAVDAMAAGLSSWDQAIARAEKGLAAEIGSAPPAAAVQMRTTLGAIYLERGRTNDALQQLDMALAIDQSLVQLHVLRALALTRLNRSADAAGAWEAAWRAPRSNAFHAYRYLTAGRAVDRTSKDAALALLAARLALGSPPSPGELTALQTLALLDDTSVPTPVFPPARYLEAFRFIGTGKYDEAVRSLRTAIASDPLVTNHAVEATDERARIARAEALIGAGNPVAARELLTETVAAVPQSGRALWQLGLLQQRFGDDDAALRAFEAAATVRPVAGAAGLYAAIGRLRHTRLALDAAAAAYRQRVAVAPAESAAHVDLGDVYRAQEQLDDALAEFSIAAVLDPSSAAAMTMIGQVHAAAGRDGDAVLALERAIRIDSASKEARYALGRALLRLGRNDDGRRELAIFEELQSKAMAEERQRFLDNQKKIQDALK